MLNMNYKKYAKVLVEAETEKNKEDFEKFFNNFLEMLKKKNQIKILPNILVEVERLVAENKKDKKSTLILKDKTFLEKYKNQISNFSDKFDIDNLEIVENKNIIGGYILKNKKYQIDNSYKKKLLNLYNKITS